MSIVLRGWPFPIKAPAQDSQLGSQVRQGSLRRTSITLDDDAEVLIFIIPDTLVSL
jgi:hypothetical protein